MDFLPQNWAGVKTYEPHTKVNTQVGVAWEGLWAGVNTASEQWEGTVWIMLGFRPGMGEGSRAAGWVSCSLNFLPVPEEGDVGVSWNRGGAQGTGE